MRRSIALWVLLVFVSGIMGCGGTSHTASSASARTTPSKGALTPHYSPAKRRYLAHFQTNCAAAAIAADASGAEIDRLIAQIGEGQLEALPRLVGYLARMSRAFEASLHNAQAFGSPPNPDSDQAHAYFREAAAVIEAIRSLSAALERVKATAVESAIHRLAKASQATQTAAERYGIPICHSEPSSGGDLASGQAV